MTVAVVLVIAFAGLFALAWHERKVAYAEILDFKERNWQFSRSARKLRSIGRSMEAMAFAIGAAFFPVMARAVQTFQEFGETMARVSQITGLTGEELKERYDRMTFSTDDEQHIEIRRHDG